jgi:hypothetical protein
MLHRAFEKHVGSRQSIFPSALSSRPLSQSSRPAVGDVVPHATSVSTIATVDERDVTTHLEQDRPGRGPV